VRFEEVFQPGMKVKQFLTVLFAFLQVLTVLYQIFGIEHCVAYADTGNVQGY
jgi:hypothetical protein